jgi:hypothetical protein
VPNPGRFARTPASGPADRAQAAVSVRRNSGARFGLQTPDSGLGP